ncbi:MAG: serine/threonine-protein kinase [Planctomycetota bacterium]
MTDRDAAADDRQQVRALAIVEELIGASTATVDRRLQALAGDDAALADEVRSLLVEPNDSFLEGGALGDVRRPMPGRAGEIVGGKYALEERIGSGAMGVVYRATHRQTRAKVAVKLLHGYQVSGDAEIERALAEARAIAAVEHESAVRVLDVEVHDDSPAIVLEWVEGVDLARWTAAASTGHGLPERVSTATFERFVGEALGREVTGEIWTRSYHEAVATIAANVARALHAAHECGVVHRDVAPKNIVVDARGRAKLVDFGIARFVDESTRSGRVDAAGTLPYMAPEQFGTGDERNRPPVDVYALGATIYQLLTGVAPYRGSSSEVLDQIYTAPTPEVRRVRPEVPRDLAAICYAAMEKRPSARYASAAELADDLDAFVDRRPVSRRPVGWMGRALRFSQRRPAHATAAAASLLFLAAGAGAASLGLDARASRRAAEQETRFGEIFASLPVSATLEAYSGAAEPPEISRSDADLEAQLGELIALRPSARMLLWTRANARSLAGHLDGATEDLDRLRTLGCGGPILDALAAALTSEDPARRNGLVPVDELPEATTAFDAAIRGYVRLRARDYDGARDELTLAIGLEPDDWMLRDLRAVALRSGGSIRLALEDALVVERHVGRTTARTSATRAYVARDSGDLERALDLYRRCLELGGDQFKVHVNAAEILTELALDEAADDPEAAERWIEDAEEHLAAARELRPTAWITAIRGAYCDFVRDQPSAALERLEGELGRWEKDDSDLGRRAFVDLSVEIANVARGVAATFFRAGDDESARAYLAYARDWLGRALDRVGEDPSASRAELLGTDAFVAWRAGEASAEQAYEQFGAAQALHAASETGSYSPRIATLTAVMLLDEEPGRVEEIRLLALVGLESVATRASARSVLAALGDSR